MGDKRYSADEERFACQNDNDNCNSNASCNNRSDSVNGYKKFVIILFVFAFVYCFRAYVIERVIVSGNSMYPTFSDGDAMWARKFDINELARYQVVVVNIRGKYVIKRIIGLPHETIQIIDGFVYINGEKLEDDYVSKTSIYGCADDAVRLEEDEYFLMGDNRDDSLDSRIWGAVNIEKIKGVVFFQFFSFGKIGFVK